MPLYLLAIFAKNEKANISAQEKQLLAKAVNELVSYWRQK
jgi:HAMP domain-containing protein